MVREFPQPPPQLHQQQRILLEEGQPIPDYRDARTTVTLGTGEETVITIRSDFEPERIKVDPDVRVLQLRREQAVYEF